MPTIYADVETAGLLDHHPTIQLAAVAIDDVTGQELSAFEQKISFIEADADPAALAINHYTKEAWKDAIEPERCAGKFSAWSRPYACIQMTSKAGTPYQVARLAGYNFITFDKPRIWRMYGTAFVPFSYHVLDAMQRVQWFFIEHPNLPKPANLKLTTVAEYFGIDTTGAHGALEDARLAARVAWHIRKNSC